MKILLLGGNGMLGFALKQVLTFEKLSIFSKEHLNITNALRLETAIKSILPDMVINCAAYTDVNLAEKEVFSCELTNSTSVKILAEICSEYDVKLMHFSTSMVFGQESEYGYTENFSPTEPVNIYGRSKKEGEDHLRMAWEKHYLIRTSWLFGPNGKNNFVDDIIEQSDINNIVDVLQNRFASPTYSFDLARAAYELILDNPPFGTYHLTNTGSTSKVNLAETILHSIKANSQIAPVYSIKEHAREPRMMVLINSKRPWLRHWQHALNEYLIGIGRMK